MDSLEIQLMEAIRDSSIDVVQSLLDRGCKVDIGDADNLTPLHLAAMRDHQEIAELLLDRGANVNRKTTDKMAPLHYAAVRGFVDMVGILIHGGANVDPLDANDRTPLMLAVSRDHLDVVQILITYGAKVNIEEIHGYTPLCEAVWNKSVEIASYLLKAGAKLTQSQYLLHYAVLHRHLAMAELLLRYGAYPNLRDEHGNTPLIVAITCLHCEMIQLLLQYEANPNYSNSITGFTPLQASLRTCCQDSQFEKILKLLCMYGVDLNPSQGEPIYKAILSGRLNSAVALIRAGADVNSQVPYETYLNYCNKSLLTFALNKKADDLVYLIVQAGFCLSKYHEPHPLSTVDTSTVEGWLTYMKYNPRRLTDLCRLRIRSQMGSRAMILIPTLEIPSSLKHFLLFKDIYVKNYSYRQSESSTVDDILF